jgi:CheY-like chemotaxis protein
MAGHSDPVILIAEDKEDDVFMLRRAFEQMAVQVPLHVVPNGEQAIAYLKGIGKFANRREFPLPDILLLDLKMPRKTGFEVLAWMRRQHDLAAIRVVILTTSEEIRDVNEAYKLGAASFLVKPCRLRRISKHFIFAMYDYWRSNQPGQASRNENGAHTGTNGTPRK